MKHNILEPCGTQCHRKCYSKMDEEQRVAVHSSVLHGSRSGKIPRDNRDMFDDFVAKNG